MEASGGRDWWAYNRDLEGRELEPWFRRAGLLLMLALSLAALFNAFGQRAHSSTASSPAAVLSVKAPSKARGGDILQARFDVRTSQEIRQPLLILDPGWLEGLTQNTSVPEPTEERTDNGRIVMEYDSIPAGRKLTVWLQYQVNPTHVGKTDQDVELWDAGTRLAHLDHSLTTFP
jgi:hypothetical protein